MNKVNILIVDDREEGLLSVQAVLTNPEYNLVTASSGTEALKYLLKDDFAVILLDVQMPVMNGFETAALIKTRDNSKDIPIIFMSAINQDEQYVYQGYNVGAVDYLLKPFDPYILRSKVAIFVDIFKKKKLIQEQARKLYESELATYAQALDRIELDSLRRYQYLADAIPQVVFRILPDGKYNYFNKVWFEFTGMSQNLASGIGWQHAIHPQDVHHLLGLFNEKQGAGCEFEGRIKGKDGSYRWHLFRIQPEFYANQETINSWLGTATDIEERKQNEDSQRFLAQAGELLVSSLDYETLLKNIASFAVPQLADWCSIDLRKDDAWQSIALVHHDAGKLEYARKIQEIYLTKPDSRMGAGKVLQTGKSILYQEINSDAIGSMVEDDEHKVLTNNLKDESAMIIPLMLNGKAFGAMTFVFSDSSRRYNENYVKMAEELGRRAGLAYENSRLYRLSQEAIEVRNEFLSIASHELNTPITSLKLHLQMTKRAMSGGHISIDKFSKSIDASVRQVDRLISLIEVLLDVSRIQAGRLNFNFEKFDLIEVINEIAERYKEVMATSNCKLELDIPSKLLVSWDKMRIEQVIINLLTNSIKYAPGKIDLTVTNDDHEVRLKIKDYGEGIPPEKLNSIFGRFERASSNRSIGGLGLGLFIVKQIIDGHNGKISVDSSAGKGSIFMVSLPYEVMKN